MGTLLLLLAFWLGVFLITMGLTALAIVWKREEKETFSSLVIWSAIVSLGIVITYSAVWGLGA